MQSEDVFERLTEADVLVEEVEGRIHRVGVTDSFGDAVDDYRDGLDEETVRESGLLELVASPDEFLALGDRALDFAAIYLALADATAEAELEEGTLSDFVPGAIFVLEHVLNGYPRTDGTPEGFLSIGGDQLELALASFDRLALYVWRDDCPTCDSMREEAEALLEEREPTVPLLSLFGPDATTTLRERFDVFGAPTTLFVHDGEVASRILGSRHKEAVAGELDALAREN